jgi:predicted dehydrogenase
MTPPPLRVGLVGCGNISDVYIRNGPRLGAYEVTACCDIDPDRAERKAAEHGISRVCPLGELLADPSIDLILNLTPPASHGPVGVAAAEAGKHVYSEKPLAIELADARRILDAARRNGRLVGCAPDTFLGAGYQTCRRLIDEGAIGVPVAAVGAMMYSGPEHWHPDPAFFYKHGAGPLFDMGPYYLTALVTLLGPVARVSAMARTTLAEREITSEPRRGQRFAVETPTHVSMSLEFASGPVATLLMSFDVCSHTLPFLQVYGSEATLHAPDPNTFGGPVALRRRTGSEASELPLDAGHGDNARGLGVADLAAAAWQGRAPRASGALALHVLQTLHATLDSAASGQAVAIEGWNQDAGAA